MRAKQLLQANSFHSERESHRSVISYCSTTREWCFLVDTSALVGTNLGNVANFCIDSRSGGISAIVGGALANRLSNPVGTSPLAPRLRPVSLACQHGMRTSAKT